MDNDAILKIYKTVWNTLAKGDNSGILRVLLSMELPGAGEGLNAKELTPHQLNMASRMAVPLLYQNPDLQELIFLLSGGQFASVTSEHQPAIIRWATQRYIPSVILNGVSFDSLVHATFKDNCGELVSRVIAPLLLVMHLPSSPEETRLFELLLHDGVDAALPDAYLWNPEPPGLLPVPHRARVQSLSQTFLQDKLIHHTAALVATIRNDVRKYIVPAIDTVTAKTRK